MAVGRRGLEEIVGAQPTMDEKEIIGQVHRRTVTIGVREEIGEVPPGLMPRPDSGGVASLTITQTGTAGAIPTILELGVGDRKLALAIGLPPKGWAPFWIQVNTRVVMG